MSEQFTWFVQLAEDLGKGNWFLYAPLEFPTEAKAREFAAKCVGPKHKIHDIYCRPKKEE